MVATLPIPVRHALVRTVAPAARILSVAEAKAQLRVSHDDEDTLINDLILVAESWLDGVSGMLGRALITQTWTYKLRAFVDRVVLPLPPLQAVATVSYVDLAGETKTLDSADYQVVAGGERPSLLVPAHGRSWPAVRVQDDAITITIVVGYGPNALDVPASLRHAARLIVSDLYAFRETAQVGSVAGQIPSMARVEALVERFRVAFF